MKKFWLITLLAPYEGDNVPRFGEPCPEGTLYAAEIIEDPHDLETLKEQSGFQGVVIWRGVKGRPEKKLNGAGHIIF